MCLLSDWFQHCLNSLSLFMNKISSIVFCVPNQRATPIGPLLCLLLHSGFVHYIHLTFGKYFGLGNIPDLGMLKF